MIIINRYITENIDSLWVEVEDSHGCTMRDTINLLFKTPPTINLGPDKAICRGTAFSLDAGDADEYLWNTGDTSRIIDINYSGNFSVLVTKNGCTNSDDVIISVNSPDSLRIDSVKARDITCFGADDGKILVFSRGEGSYYEFSIDNGQSWDANSGFFENLPPGSEYTIMVIEDSACSKSWPQSITINEPEQIEVGARLISPSCDLCTDGQIILKLSGGTPPYDILWSNFETDIRRKGIGVGEYSVSITDSAYCNVLTTIELGMDNQVLKIPNAFTPNGDGINDTWIITALNGFPDAIVKVFDRSGKLVFESAPGYPDAWDGKNNNGFLPMGSYYYVIKLNDLLDLIPGNVTIIR